MLNTELKRTKVRCFFENNSFVVIKFSKKIYVDYCLHFIFLCNAKNSFFTPKLQHCLA